MALILVVDDSSFQRRLLRKYVEVEGHQVIEATNGREGLDAILSQSPDCVFLDLIMPESNGFELLENIREQKIDIPAVVVTADVQASTHQQCLELGAFAVVNKPVDSKKLNDVLAEILGPEKEELS